MGGIALSIGLGIVSNFATDLIRWASGSHVNRIEEAVKATENAFPGLEGVADALRTWLTNENVRKSMERFLQGRLGVAEVPISDLHSAFLAETNFFLPDHANAVAEKIVHTFLVKIRAAYLSEPPLAGPYLANRLDTQERILTGHNLAVLSAIETLGGLKPSLDRMFKNATKELDTGNVAMARSLLESLLSELTSSSFRHPQLERAIHAKLGVALSHLGDQQAAAENLRLAAELDKEDPVRGAINAANADMLLNRPEEAYQKLSKLVDVAGDNLFNFWHTKALALVGLSRFDEALTIARGADIGGKEDARHGLAGAILLHARRFDEAAGEYLLAIAANPLVPEWHFGAGEMTLMPLVDERNKAPLGHRSQEFADKLARAECYLRDASVLFRSHGRSTAAIHADEKLALALFLQERFHEGINILEPAVRGETADRQNLVNLGFAYLRVKEPRKGSEALKRALLLQWDSGLERMYIHALVEQGRFNEAIAFLKERTSYPINEMNLETFISLAEALSASREYGRAKAILEELSSVFPSRADVLLSTAEFQSMISNRAAAEAAFEAALQNSAGPFELLVRAQFGHFCMGNEKFARAVELWKPLMEKGGPHSLQTAYTVALFNSRSYAELVRFAALVQLLGDRLTVNSAHALSAAYEHLDELESARLWLEYVCAHDTNRPEYIRRLAHIELRLGHREKALDLLDAAVSSLSEPEELLGFAKAYSLLDQPQKALGLAYTAAQSEKSAEIYSGYIGAFLAAGEDKGVTRSPEQIALFQSILSNWNQLFPNAKQVQTFHFDPEDPLESMRKVLLSHSEAVEKASDAYRKRSLPVTSFAKAIGRDMFDLWRNMLGHAELTIVFADGTEDEAARFQQLLTSSSGIILEPVALFTLHRLNFLDKLQEIGDVYIAQPVLDYLHYMQSKRRIGKEQGSMGFYKGQFFMNEVSAETVAQIDAELDSLTAWVERSGVVRGFVSPLSEIQGQWIEALGEATLGTLAIAKQRSVLLVADDKVLAHVAAQTHNIEAINSQAVLVYLLSKGAISETEYADAVLKLVDDGYTFVRLNEEQMFLRLDREDFQITSAVVRLLRILESPTTELESACLAAAGLLRRLFAIVIPTDVREGVGRQVLDSLAKRHPKEEIRHMIKAALGRTVVSLKPFQIRFLYCFLSNW